MRKITLLLTMCLMCVGLFAQTNSYTRLADFNAARTNSKVYALKTTRSPLYWNTTNNELAGYWTAESQGLKGNLANVSDQFQQFAFLRTENTAAERYYMWSVAGQCFVTIAGAKSEEPVANVWLKDVTDKDNASHLGMKLYIGETGDNVVNVTYWNNNTAGGVRYNDNSEADAGNVYEFIALDADVDLSVAMDKINELEGNGGGEGEGEEVVDFTDKSIQIGSATNSLQTGKWYLLYNQGRTSYVSEETTALMMRGLTSGVEATEHLGKLFKFTSTGEANQYYIQSANGKYFDFQVNDQSIVTETPVAYNVRNIGSSTNCFYIQHAGNGFIADGQPMGKNFVCWEKAVPSTTGGNNSYQFMEVEFIAALPTPELPDPIEASAFVAGKNYLIKNAVVNKYLYNDGNALKLGTIADLANIPAQYLFAAVEVTGGVALMASNGEYVPGTGADGTALTTTATPTAVNVSAKGGTYPATNLNVSVGESDNYWNIKGGATGSDLCFYFDQNDPNGVWEFRNMGDSGVVGPDPEPGTFPVKVTEVSQLSNNVMYTITSKDTGRGSMYALSSKVDMCAVTYAAGSDACHSVAYNAADPMQQFAFVQYDGKYYLYSVGQKKFVGKSGDVNHLTDAAPFDYVVVTEEADAGQDYFSLFINNANYITASPGWCSNASRNTCLQTTLTSKVPSNGWDDGAWFTITAVGEFNPAEALALLNPAPAGPSAADVAALLETAQQALALDGVGYPVEAEREVVANAKAALENEATQENYDALSAKLTAYAATTNVNMPENGKAYKFVNKQKNGTLYYMKYAESGMTFTSDAAEATPFVCKVLDNGKFVFVNNAGKYMVWRGSNAGTNEVKGYVDAYDTSAEAWCDIELTKVVEGTSVEAGNEEALFGCLYFKGRRNPSTAAKDYFAYTVIKADGTYDQAAVPFFNANFSSAIMLVEETYPNTPELKDAAGLLDVTALATFSAPFATVVPEGVTAWYASESEGEYVVMKEVDGAIPAGQGVVLSGDLGNVTMVPAAAEDQADLTGNVLVGTAGAAKDFTSNEGVYILGNKGGQVAFYPLASAPQTLGMNKAYLQLAAGGAVVKMNFGGESTGIVAVEKGLNENAPIYDLSGRRVLNTVKGGVYIQAGRKFIVK